MLEEYEEYDVYYGRELFQKLVWLGVFGVAVNFLTGLMYSSQILSWSMGLLVLGCIVSITAQCLLFDAFKLIRFPLKETFLDRTRGVVFGGREIRCYVVFSVVLLNYFAAAVWVGFVSAVLTVISPWVVLLGLSSGTCVLSMIALRKYYPITESFFNLMMMILIAIMLV